jgi:carbon monoxide dehydrogenase subunit G
MELTNEFVVERPIDETWKIINDLEFIAPCMPGAQLTEIEGDEYRGLVKIKVGPISAKYKGKASFISQDEVAKVSKLSAEGRDPRNGNANAVITATMSEVPSGTLVVIHTDLALVGKVASFGRGAIEDVSKKLLTMFSDNLRDKLAKTDADGSSDSDSKPAADAAATASGVADAGVSTLAGVSDSISSDATSSGSEGAESGSTKTEEPKVRKINSEEPDAVDLFSVTGDSMLKRLAPVLGGVLALFVLRMLLRGRATD